MGNTNHITSTKAKLYILAGRYLYPEFRLSPFIKNQNLGHLGLVAGFYEELGIGKLIDTLIPQDLDEVMFQLGR